MTSTPTFVATVNENHTIVLPGYIPVGAKIAVFLIPSEEVTAVQLARRGRFSKVMTAIHNAIADGFVAPEISYEELDARIKRARREATM